MEGQMYDYYNAKGVTPKYPNKKVHRDNMGPI